MATVHDIDDSMEMHSKKQTNKQNKTKKKKNRAQSTENMNALKHLAI